MGNLRNRPPARTVFIESPLSRQGVFRLSRQGPENAAKPPAAARIIAREDAETQSMIEKVKCSKAAGRDFRRPVARLSPLPVSASPRLRARHSPLWAGLAVFATFRPASGPFRALFNAFRALFDAFRVLLNAIRIIRTEAPAPASILAGRPFSSPQPLLGTMIILCGTSPNSGPNAHATTWTPPMRCLRQAAICTCSSAANRRWKRC